MISRVQAYLRFWKADRSLLMNNSGTEGPVTVSPVADDGKHGGLYIQPRQRGSYDLLQAV